MPTIHRTHIHDMKNTITKAILLKHAEEIIETRNIIENDEIELHFTVNGIEIDIASFDEIINREMISYKNKLDEKYKDIDALATKMANDKLSDIMRKHGDEYISRLNKVISSLESMPWITTIDSDEWSSSY